MGAAHRGGYVFHTKNNIEHIIMTEVVPWYLPTGTREAGTLIAMHRNRPEICNTLCKSFLVSTSGVPYAQIRSHAHSMLAS